MHLKSISADGNIISVERNEQLARKETIMEPETFNAICYLIAAFFSGASSVIWGFNMMATLYGD